MAEANKSSPWVWISLIIIIGLFVLFIFFLDQKIVKSGQQPVEESRVQKQTDKPIIDFYEVLKQRNFDVPDDRTEKVKNKTETNKTQAASNGKYLLQAGSFIQPEDAEKTKAELALLGLEASIKKADVSGVGYHRVVLGPFADDGFYSKVKNRLISNKIHYIQKSLN